MGVFFQWTFLQWITTLIRSFEQDRYSHTNIPAKTVRPTSGVAQSARGKAFTAAARSRARASNCAVPLDSGGIAVHDHDTPSPKHAHMHGTCNISLFGIIPCIYLPSSIPYRTEQNSHIALHGGIYHFRRCTHRYSQNCLRYASRTTIMR